MEYAAIAAGLALIAYGVVILRRPWVWYLTNEAEPFDWWPKPSAKMIVRAVGGVADTMTGSYAAQEKHRQEPTPADFQYAGEWRAYLNSRPTNSDLDRQMQMAQNVHPLQYAANYSLQRNERKINPFLDGML